MSFKSGLIKLGIKLTPVSLIRWGFNSRMKGIVQLRAFKFDLDSRRLYVQVHLIGEAEPIEVLLENFGVVQTEKGYSVVLEQAKANRVWLTNALGKVTGRHWKIPVVPQLAKHMPLVMELLGAKGK